MKTSLLSQSQANMKSLDSMLQQQPQPGTSRKQLPNKLKIQFSPTKAGKFVQSTPPLKQKTLTKNVSAEMMSGESNLEKLHAWGTQRLPTYSGGQANHTRKSNLKIYSSND